MTKFTVLFGSVALALTNAFAQTIEPWRDPSPHRTQFVTVADGVQLEVLDWGGAGQNIVLLAGSGNTAHVFDDFAQKLARSGHVYGITRRGFGADDVLHVLDAVKISQPVMVGHSLAGSEMTTLGSQHSNRLAGLAYLDAGDDPGDYPGDPAYRALFAKLPASVTRAARAPAADRKSFQAYRDWQTRTSGFAEPESELRYLFNANPDGSVGPLRPRGPASQDVSQAIGEGSKKRDYSRISVPILYLPASPPRANGWSQYYRFTPANDSERLALQKIYDADRANLDRYEKNMQTSQATVRIVELRGAGHYVYITNESAVLRELHKFLVDLRSSSLHADAPK